MSDTNYHIDGQGFAVQKLTEKQKIKEFGSVDKWAQASMLSILRMSTNRPAFSTIESSRDQINYDLYNDVLHEEDFKHVIEPYGKRLGNFPATLRNYNIIKPKIDLLIGEEMKRPFNFRAVASNPETISEITETKKQLIIEYLNNQILTNLQAQGIPIENPETGEVMTPPQIEEYITHKYKHIKESVANKSLKYLIKYLHIKEMFNDGFADMLKAGKEFYWTGIINGEPALRLVNPVYFKFDLSPDLKYIEDSQWAFEERYLTPSEVYDEFYDDLTEEDVERIETFRQGNMSSLFPSAQTSLADGFDALTHTASYPFAYDINSRLIRVVQYEWKSLKKIGFLTYIDEKGIPQETIVDETFKESEFKKTNPDQFIDIDWKWINCVWQGTQIAGDIFCKIQEKPYQYWNIDNLSECKLSYTGIVYNKRNSIGTSLVEVMKPWQYLYNILMYRLELTFAKAKDKVFLMDLAQIPRSMGFDVEKWMYYMDALGVAFINSFEEGAGLGAGRSSGFNQFSEIDLSLARVVDQYIMALERIKEEIGEISGVSKQRQGQVQSNELVGNVERTIIQSSHITEPLFEAHQNVKQRVLTNLLESAKVAWVNGKKAQYVLDDMSRVVFEIDGPEIADTQVDVFISSSSKDEQLIETIKQLAQQAVGNQQAKLSDVIAIFESESISDMKNKLLKAEQQAVVEAQQMEQQKLEVQQSIHEEQMMDRQAERDLKDQMNIRDNDTDILIEKMKIQGGMMEETEEGVNVVGDIIELEKINQKRQEVAQKLGLEADKIELEKEKLWLEKQKFRSQEELTLKQIEANKEMAKDKDRVSLITNRDKLNTDVSLNEKEANLQRELQNKELSAKEKIEKMKAELKLKEAKLRPKPNSNKK